MLIWQTGYLRQVSHTRAMAVLSVHSRINPYVVPAVTSATEAVSV